MKRVLVVVLALAMVFSLSACSLGGENELEKFHSKVSECQELLDSVADDIYSNWHAAVYEDEFEGDIDVAILSAQIDHSDDLDAIEVLDSEISKLFKEVKDGKQGRLAKEVMSAYSDYYEFVVNVSGSFNSFSADKENLKKELASVLKDLSYEL